MKMGFDIKKNKLSEKAEAGHEFEVKYPDGSSSGLFITVRGTLSNAVKKFSKELFNKQQQKEISLRRKGKTDEPVDIDELEETIVATAVSRIISWRGLEDDGKEVPFTKEVATALLAEESWMREQVLDESDNAANFI